MLMKDAIVLRFQMLCDEKKVKFNDLAVRSGITPSTVYSMMKPVRRDTSVNTVKKLCDGLEITVPEFFNHELFFELEQEVK